MSNGSDELVKLISLMRAGRVSHLRRWSLPTSEACEVSEVSDVSGG